MYVKSFNHINASWLSEVCLCVLFFQREAAGFWDACLFDLVHSFSDDSGLNKKRKEGKKILFQIH